MKGVKREIKVFSVLNKIRQKSRIKASSQKIKNVPERIGDRLDALETKIEEILDRIKLAKDYNILPSHLANAFVINRPFVASSIMGATSLDQIKENIKSLDIILDKEILKNIEEIHLSDPNPCV